MVYFLTTAETCAAYGVPESMLVAERKLWQLSGTGNFAQPVLMDDNTWRYRRDSVVGAVYRNEFLDVMRREHHAWVEADKLKSLAATAATN